MLFAFFSYKEQFVTCVSNLIDKAVDLTMLKLHAERLADIALATPEPREEALAQAEPRRAVAIELRNVAFRYGENEPWVLQGVSFRVEAGETVAIVGPSGCGKTTLLRIVLLLDQATSRLDAANEKAVSATIRAARVRDTTCMRGVLGVVVRAIAVTVGACLCIGQPL